MKELTVLFDDAMARAAMMKEATRKQKRIVIRRDMGDAPIAFPGDRILVQDRSIALAVRAVYITTLNKVRCADAVGRGGKFYPTPMTGKGGGKLRLQRHWRKIYGKSWNDNPHVWVIEFERVEP